MAKGQKITDAEFSKRVAMVTDMLLSGLRRVEILQNASNSSGLNWNVSNRQIDTYIAEATKEIEKMGEKNADKTYKKVKARYEFLWRKSINVKDYKTAMAINDKEAELDGVKSPAKTDITSGGKELISNVVMPEIKVYLTGPEFPKSEDEIN